MTERTHCIYCNKEITTRSKEHVIQNALGGLLESTDICCADCNNFISKYIDAPFTKTFNPIISQIQNFSKTNNTKSLQPCTGKVLYNGELYDANIKAGKVVSCPELSRKLRCDIILTVSSSGFCCCLELLLWLWFFSRNEFAVWT